MSADNWDLFDTWRPPIAVRPSSWSWSEIESLMQAARTPTRAVATEVRDLLQASDRGLADLDGDPSRVNWRRFRPLRLSREEDWSDWLAWLLEDSRTGVFASRLLGAAGLVVNPAALCPMSVDREVQVAGGERRVDLLLCWGPGRDLGHIEVKIDDQSRSKTGETARLLKGERGVAHHFLLLREEHLELWSTERAGLPDGSEIPSLTWRDVSSALRFGLKAAEEGSRWRIFAHAFAGAVEQQILGHPQATDERLENSSIGDFGALVSLRDILREGDFGGMPNEEMRQFLTKGVGRYREVIRVIDAFKDGLGDWLAEILKAFDKWPKSFDPDPKGTTTRGLSKYIYAEMPGLLGRRKTKLSIGLWCGHSFATDSESIIYAEIRFDGQAEKTPFTDNVTTERVKIHSPWLYVEVSASPDVEHDCRALLEEVAAQLPSMEAGAT